jgi:uncharacterized protein (DUF1015 family)
MRTLFFLGRRFIGYSLLVSKPPHMIQSCLIMDGISPLRAIRYNLSKVKKLGRVIAPPYDCISPDQQRLLYKKSPYNCVRLVLRKGSFGKHVGPRHYQAVARDFQIWLRQGVLRQDSDPGYYVYQQSYLLNGRRFVRTGLFSLLELSGYGKRILPHEHTMKGPKKDRLDLLKATQANLSAIFGLFEDSKGKLARLYQPIVKKKPLVSVMGDGKIRHRLWQVSAQAQVRSITRALRNKRIWIADGHHRCETAFAFRKWAKKHAPGLNSGYVLSCLVAMEDPGCQVLPIHRAIRLPSKKDASRLMIDLGRRFRVEEVSTLKQLVKGLAKRTPKHKIGMTDGRNFFLLHAPRKKADDLDVTFFERRILSPLAKRVQLRKGHEVQFEHSPQRIQKLLRKGMYHVGFLLAATGLDEMKRLTRQGQRMPEKSTYFYPKIGSGFLFNKL